MNKKKIIIYISVLIIIFGVFSAISLAITKNKNLTKAIISAFKYYEDINPEVDILTVVEVPFKDVPISRYDFAIVDKTSNEFEPYIIKNKIKQVPIKEVEAKAEAESGQKLKIAGSSNNIIDNNYST